MCELKPLLHNLIRLLIGALAWAAIASPLTARAQPDGDWRRSGRAAPPRGVDARFGRPFEGGLGYTSGFRPHPYGGGYATPSAPPPRYEVQRVDPGSRLWNRGQVLPPDYRGASVPDPGRYHLRTPPSGYGWVGDGRNAYLMQRSTGMVLDSVPEAYAPPRSYRHR